MKRWLIFDVETTGFSLPSVAALASQPRIIEVGLVEIAEGKITRENSWLVNPGVPLLPEITRITHLDDVALRDAPPFGEAVREFGEWFRGAHGLVAHNLPFDRGMLQWELRRAGIEETFPLPPEQICTVAAWEHLKGRRMKLTELYALVMGRELKQTHRALDDARALAEIVLKERICDE